MNVPTQLDLQAGVRNARAEAADALASVGLTGSARVLEPSPPAVTVEPYLADDPVAVDVDGQESNLILPAGVTGPGATWDAAVADPPQLGSWAADRWLTTDRRFAPLAEPTSLATTRTALHRLAAYVIAPVRHQASGKFGLRWTKDGFGTPFFLHHDGRNRQIRVQADAEKVLLVDQIGDTVRSDLITSLAQAAAFLHTEIDGQTAAEHDSPPVGDPYASLAVEAGAARFLGSWFAMAFAGLESFRSRPDTVDPGRPQLWPGHFDPAVEAGTEATRASYGASPGDEANAEPYLYVSVWWPDRVTLTDEGDNAIAGVEARGFTGRLLPLSHFPADTDPAEVAARFWSTTAAAIRPVD